MKVASRTFLSNRLETQLNKTLQLRHLSVLSQQLQSDLQNIKMCTGLRKLRKIR